MDGVPNPYPPLATPRPGHSEYWIPSAAGAYGPTTSPGGAISSAGRWHAGLDWFAPAGTVVRAMQAGTIVEARPDLGGDGKVFGGTVKIMDARGMLWVTRHVSPTVKIGDRVVPGNAVARVSEWAGGSSHAHVEVWRSRGGGYSTSNLLDPWAFTFSTRNGQGDTDAPPPFGASLRLTLNGETFAGWAECAGRLTWIAEHGLSPTARCAISWRGNVWRGPSDVTNVARSLVRRYL